MSSWSEYAGSEAPRGAAAVRPEERPLSIGLVIGIGGSGIQTISRIRAAIMGDRPDAAATPSIQFLGIDAVDLGKQIPPLPPGVGLGGREFVNLTTRPFDAYEYVKQVSGADTDLGKWWDSSYQVPVGPLVDGLKQARMLGRLAFYRESGSLTSRIAAAAREAVALRREHMEGGTAATDAVAVLKVFVVASSCGGTGSAGTLEVLHKIWAALKPSGITPEIRLFTYLPGIFETAVSATSTAAVMEVANQKANAYAYLRELDHFVTHSDELHAKVAQPSATPFVDIPAGQLVKQVYMLDATIEGAGRLSEVTDSYEIVAEAIYQFLMTDAGRPQIAQNGTNSDAFLQLNDVHDKRRIYCGIGLSSITYPGETFRRHMRARFSDWLIRDLLAARPVNLVEQVHDSATTKQLVSSLQDLTGEVRSAGLPAEAKEFRASFEEAPEVLREEQGEDTVSRLLIAFEGALPRAVKALKEQAQVMRQQLLQRLEGILVTETMRGGESVPFLAAMLKSCEKAFESQLGGEAEARATQSASAAQFEKDANELRTKLRALNARRLVRPGARGDVGVKLGNAVQSWGRSVIAEQRATDQVELLRDVVGRLAEARGELERAEVKLGDLAAQAVAAWTADDLIGKDAGPRDTTALIPSDCQPEVEESSLLIRAFNAVLEKMAVEQPEDLLQDLYASWLGSVARGPFAFGSNNPDEAERARRALIAQLDVLADRFALEMGQADISTDGATPHFILPRTLLAAAEMTDQGGSVLDQALRSLVRLAGRACWSWNAANLGEVEVNPSPSTVIIRPASLSGRMDGFFSGGVGLSFVDSPDQERIVALTTEWGVSAHALTPVASWSDAYEKQLHGLKGDATRKRPHLDRRFATSLDPLQPSYFDRDAILETLARALLIGRMTSDDEVGHKIYGPVRRLPAAPLTTVDLGDELRWKGAVHVEDEAEGTWSVREEVDLGGSLSELVDRSGANPGWRQPMERLSRAVVMAGGRLAAMKSLETLKTQYGAQVDKDGLPAADRKVADELVGEFVILKDRYETTELSMTKTTHV